MPQIGSKRFQVVKQIAEQEVKQGLISYLKSLGHHGVYLKLIKSHIQNTIQVIKKKKVIIN